MLTYSRFLPKIPEYIQIFGNILHINKYLYELFDEGQVTTFKRNKNLNELTGNTIIEKGNMKKPNNNDINGKFSPCLSKTGNLFPSQVIL